MFDYQAGEKYRLTLIMVAAVGFLAGIFLTILLMPTPAPERKIAYQKWMSDPDVTGGRSGDGGQSPLRGGGNRMVEGAPPASSSSSADAEQAKSMIQAWLPLAWDLSAATARSSQEKAIAFMTPDVAETYRKNVWSPELAEQIESSGVKSSFKADRVFAGGSHDGAVVVFVDGMQTLVIPGKGQTARPVKLEYMVKNTPEGMKIVGISEGGQSS
jgi:hypothetical protein